MCFLYFFFFQIQGKSQKSGSPGSSISGKNISPVSSVLGTSVHSMNGTNNSFTSVTPTSFDHSSMYNQSSRTFPHPKPVLISFEVSKTQILCLLSLTFKFTLLKKKMKNKNSYINLLHGSLQNSCQ